MAEAFQTVNTALGSSADAVVYTCPASKIAVVVGIKLLMWMVQMLQI